MSLSDEPIREVQLLFASNPLLLPFTKKFIDKRFTKDVILKLESADIEKVGEKFEMELGEICAFKQLIKDSHHPIHQTINSKSKCRLANNVGAVKLCSSTSSQNSQSSVNLTTEACAEESLRPDAGEGVRNGPKEESKQEQSETEQENDQNDQMLDDVNGTEADEYLDNTLQIFQIGKTPFRISN